MATAVEPSSQSRTPGAAMSLPVASLLGTIYVLAALAVIFYALPVVWRENITPRIGDRVVDWFLWVPVLCGVVVGLGWFGQKLAGDSAPVGFRGGIFLMISAAITVFFLVRAV